MQIKNLKTVHLIRYISVLFIVSLLLSACSSKKNGTESGGGDEAITAAEQPTAVALPTEMPTEVAGVVVMTYESQAASGVLEEARTNLTELAASSGMTFEEYPSLQPGEVKDNWKVVVLMSVPANINELVASAPGTQFVVISESEQAAASNLSVIRKKVENQAFIAGFVSLMIASDWRTGALMSDDPALASIQEEAFINGGHYICGRCTSTWMPVKAFPLVAHMPAGTDLAGWQSVVAEMQMNVIYVMYVAPEVATPELLLDLASRGLVLVGGATPPDEVRSMWAGTISFDSMTSIKDIWEDLLAGQGGQVVDASIKFSDINTQYFSQGRGRQAQDTVKKLTEGVVSPLTPSME